MKKYFLTLLAVSLFMSCSSDDEATTPDPQGEDPQEQNEDPSGTGLLRIAQVDAANDLITLQNLGDGAMNIGDYFLCLGPGTYRQISGLTNEDTTLDPNETLELSYDVNAQASGFGVFAVDSFQSTDAAILLDYVQWGGANQARVDQAVTAGRWDDAANFVAGVDLFEFIGNSNEFGSEFWTGQDGRSVVRILEVDAPNDQITLSNFGNVAIDITDHWLCLGPGTYAKVGDIATGDTTLDPDEEIVVTYDVNPDASGLGLFSTNSFSSSDPEILLDYVQWGAGNQARVGQAITAGRWNSETAFVPLATLYEFNGAADDFGSDFWN